MSAVTGSGYEVSAPSAPTGATSTTGVDGELDVSANYLYKVTYVNPYGESAPSSASSSISSGTAQAITLTIPVSSDPTVTARKIYRTQGGGATYGLLDTVEDNTTTEYEDIIADASLGAAPATTNSAMSRQTVKGNVKFNMPIQQAAAVITAGTTQTQAGATETGLNMFVSVNTANAADGVILPLINANMVGMAIFIQNTSATLAINVYPNTGQTINAGSANAALSHAAATGRWYVASSATNWQKV